MARAHSDAEVAHLVKCGATLTIMGEAEIARAMLSLCQNLAAASAEPQAAEPGKAVTEAKPNEAAEQPVPKPSTTTREVPPEEPSTAA